MQYVTDTNIWYDIVDGNISPNKIFTRNDKIYATAINIVEIVTSKYTFLKKKAVLKAIKTYNTDILPLPVMHLAFLFGYKVDTDSFFWKEIINGFITNTILPKNIIEYQASFIAIKNEYYRFSNSINQFNDRIVPGHSKIQQKNQIIKGDLRKLYIDFFSSRKYRIAFFEMMEQYLIELLDESNIKKISYKTGKEIYKIIEPYFKVHRTYELECGINIKTKKNDYADLQHFLYLQNGKRFLTSENRWFQIARKAKINSLIINPKILPFVP